LIGKRARRKGGVRAKANGADMATGVALSTPW
jgi:hypothetical protein